MSSWVDQYVVLVDTEGLGMKNFNLKKISRIQKIPAAYMIERNYKSFIFNQPFVFSALFNLVKPILNKEIRNKIVMLTKKNKSVLECELTTETVLYVDFKEK